MGCDTKIRFAYANYEISIHAPAWGATKGVQATVIHSEISIHAPAWGAT